ncbi:MAG: histidine ammonia-lyase [Ignavibacteriae bacterium]|nr:histidine ammonia-lyase [Ignavibacteria bacterium]MBI3364218.1 histidine ammonia-lyase [Ignavibacteriota bacterium]
MKTLILDGNSLTIEAVYQAALSPSEVAYSREAKKRINASRRVVEEWIRRDETIYGVTTGFGEFSNVKIGKEHLAQLQENLIVSHSAGTGEPLPPEIVRAMTILRLNALAKGYSGIRLETMEFFREVFNRGIMPVIPSKGSVGSSGDLAPLAHLVLPLLGKGKVWYEEAVMDSALALKKTGLKPWTLTAKEGLALVNGTQMMTAYAVLSVYEAMQLCKSADIAAAMSVEALKGSDTAFDARIHTVRPHKGQRECAANLRKLMYGSEIRESHRFGDHRVQDAYSIRCIPQVHGASRDTVRYVYDVVTTEINSATDNPLIFPEDAVHLEGGNFHGQPIALALDFLAIALAELANISERRIERTVNGSLSGLPRFLTVNGGLNSGMMLAQYTAASLVSENKVLAHPASVDSIPTSANQEDHNSMGSISAQKLWQVLRNVQTVIAIEMMVAAQGIDFSRIHPETRSRMRAGKGVQAAYGAVRKHISHLKEDRVLAEDIATVLQLLKSGAAITAVEKAVGKLK